MRKKGLGGGEQRRRSARISALEEAAANNQKAKPSVWADNGGTVRQVPFKKVRKRKRLEDVADTSAAIPVQEEDEEKMEQEHPSRTDRRVASSSRQRLPQKSTLEYVLDVLQTRDSNEFFGMPVKPEEVDGYEKNIKEPMDFGTMRAKLHDGLYTTLEQFERDAFLICNNAMHFNSSTTIFYREARIIYELAQRVFDALKTDPENFELQFAPRRRSGRKNRNEARTMQEKINKPPGPSLRRNTPARRRDYYGSSSGSRNGTNLDFDKRQTYRPYSSFLSENESIVLSLHNAPKTLAKVNQGELSYEESLMRFVPYMGPKAQMIAEKKLGFYPVVGAPSFPSLTPLPTSKTPSLIPALRTPSLIPTTVPNGSAQFNGVNKAQMFQQLLGYLPENRKIINDANKSLEIRTNGSLDIDCASRGDMSSIYRNKITQIQAEGSRVNDQRDNENSFLGEMTANFSGMDTSRTSRGKMICPSDHNVNFFNRAGREDTKNGLIGNTSASVDRTMETSQSAKGKIICASDGNGDLSKRAGREDPNKNSSFGDVTASFGSSMNTSRSSLGKMVCTSNNNLDFFNRDGRGDNKNGFLGDITANICGNMEIHHSPIGKMACNRGDGLDLILGSSREQYSHQNKNPQLQLGSYSSVPQTQKLSSPTLIPKASKLSFMDMMVESCPMDNQVEPSPLATNSHSSHMQYQVQPSKLVPSSHFRVMGNQVQPSHLPTNSESGLFDILSRSNYINASMPLTSSLNQSTTSFQGIGSQYGQDHNFASLNTTNCEGQTSATPGPFSMGIHSDFPSLWPNK